MEYTITKSTVECYKLRLSSGMYWADITIDQGEKAGRIQIASDYGDWQNYWGHCGMPFKKFLMSLNIDYVAGKFGVGKVFDLEATCKSMRTTLKEEYKGLPKEKRKALEQEIKTLENNCSNEHDFYHAIQDTENLFDFCDQSPDICHKIDPHFRKFWEQVWPVFIEQLKKEIES